MFVDNSCFTSLSAMTKTRLLVTLSGGVCNIRQKRAGSRLVSSGQSRWFASNSVAEVLRRVEEGKLSAKDAEKLMDDNEAMSGTLNSRPKDEILQSFANLDHTRALRTGFPEAVFAQGKTPRQVATILDDMAYHVNISIKNNKGEETVSAKNNLIAATRVDKQQWEEIERIPLQNGTITYHEVSRIISMKASALESTEHVTKRGVASQDKSVVVACAGTTDLPVAEEAAVTLELAGCNVERVYDVGVAGLHRIIDALPRLRSPSVKCVIVCAGMDGALPSVVGGLVSVPVVAVPTSVGYGASFSGVSALLTMLNSCAPGVCVVNIDNGFGAAALAFKMI